MIGFRKCGRHLRFNAADWTTVFSKPAMSRCHRTLHGFSQLICLGPGALDDESFAIKMLEDGGVASIPMSAFYARDPLRSIVRLCFTKHADTIDRAIERFAEMRKSF